MNQSKPEASRNLIFMTFKSSSDTNERRQDFERAQKTQKRLGQVEPHQYFISAICNKRSQANICHL